METMNKISKLLKKIDAFCTQALCSFLIIKNAAEPQGFYMPDDPEEISKSGSISERAEQFDIKKEELFNQFESFMAAYNELVDSLNVDAKSLDPEVFENAGQLIDTLNKRYERIMNNPYLNAGEDFDEDFNPGDLSQFIQDAVEDAENKLKAVAGEDISIDEMRAAQYAQEFNDNKNIDRGDPNVTWTGNKVQQNLEARREWFRKLMFAKKLGKNHPEYQRYERYIQARRNSFKAFLERLRKEDPNNWRTYQNKMNERVKKHYHKQKEKSPEKHLEKAKTKADKIRAVKQSDTLEGYIVHLKQKLATTKSEAAKGIKKKAALDPFFAPYKEAVQTAKERLDTEASPTNQQLLEEAVRAEAQALKDYLDSHPTVLKIVEDLKVLYAFRDKVKQISDAGWVGDEGIPDEVKPALYQVVVEGETLIKQFSRIYKSPCVSVLQIVDFILNKFCGNHE